MNIFLVSAQDGESALAVDKLIKEVFEKDKVFRVKGRASSIWLIAASEYTTVSDIGNMLNIGGDEDPQHTGFIMRIDSYGGYDSVDLWQKLRVWTKK